jgi:predicted transposase YbfD/YdcC
VRAWFDARCFTRGAPDYLPAHDSFDDSHGRLMRRRVFACRELGALPGLQDWPDVRAVLAVETIRSHRQGRIKTTAEIRYFLTSAELDPKRLGQAVRRHWSIENGLHWVLDVIFAEDRCRVSDRHAARNLACLRKIALHLARADHARQASLRRKRKQAAWDDSYMAQLIQADLMR